VPWLGRADGRTHGAVLDRLAARVLERRARVGVDQLALPDVGVGPLDEQARVLTLEQRAGDSAGPEVDALAGVLGDLVVDHYVGQLKPPAGPQHAVDLVEHRVLVGHEAHASGLRPSASRA
jgi:hypothetical protein